MVIIKKCAVHTEGLDYNRDGVAQESNPLADGYLSIENEDGQEMFLNLQCDADGLFDSETAVGEPFQICDSVVI